MALPFVLAGPILRRVESKLVSVWIALSRPASITITLWEGRVKGGDGWLFMSNPPTATLRIADNLHVAMVLAHISPDSNTILRPGVIYSYDLTLTEGANGHTLRSLGLLKSEPTTNGGPAGLERPHLALGYVEDILPSFAMPPERLEDLRIVYGSCRRPVNEHPDAMAMIDDLIANPTKPPIGDPVKRPHHLVLGGDQIYADDLWPGQLMLVSSLALDLIGTWRESQTAPLADRMVSLETVPVDKEFISVDEPLEHQTYPDGWKPGGPTPIPCGLDAFPAGRRRSQLMRLGQMTTTDGESHVFSFGEFAALYLMVWSNACWPLPNQWPSPQEIYAPEGIVGKLTPAPEYEAPRMKWDQLTAEDVGETPGKVYEECKDKKGADLAACVLEQRQKLLIERCNIKIDQMKDFYEALPKVRRILANVPTMMIMDDHDVTDDWNLNPIWVDRVNSSSLGRAILRNALAAYTVFQDWGNDPLRYLNEDVAAAGHARRMLLQIAKMFPERTISQTGSTNSEAKPATPDVPAQPVMQELDAFYGLNKRSRETLDGSFELVAPPIAWHWRYKGPGYLMVALDNRTRRSFASREGPPGNVAVAAQSDMIPDSLPAEDEVLIVVAPLQVMGAGILDELIGPMTYRVYDARGYSKHNPVPTAADARVARLDLGTRRMAGTDPDAIEAWAGDPLTLEALLKRMAVHKRVVILSGDVHHAEGNAMSYWIKGIQSPARIVQFTSSGFKNVMPANIGAADRVLSFAQRILRSNIGTERMGWNTADGQAFVFASGHGLVDTPPVLRRKLRKSPMLIPTFGWPEGTTVNPVRLPDWSWRLKPLLDVRPESERPPPAQLRALDPSEARLQAILVNRQEPGNEMMAYATIAARHQDQFDKLRHARQFLFRANFAQLRFERSNGLVAVNEVHTALPDSNAPPGTPPQVMPYMVHRASLEPQADEVRPELAPMQLPAF